MSRLSNKAPAATVAVPRAPDTTVWLRIEGLELEADRRAQRAYSAKRAAKIAQEFDPDYVGVIHVSERSDGRRYIVDGQHRVGALRILGWLDQRVECKVYVGLTLAQEAKLFVHLNNFVRVQPFDNFMVRITARDPDAVAIDEIVRAAGLIWALSSTRENSINCVTSLEKLYLGEAFNLKARQPAVLKDTLALLGEAWGMGHDAFRGDVVSGLGAFLLRYGRAVDKEHLRRKLSATAGGPLGILGKARTLRTIEGGTLAISFSKSLIHLYNRGLRSDKKLPDWQG